MQVAHFLRFLLRLVHFPDPGGDADLKIRALDEYTPVLLGEPFDVERISGLALHFAGSGDIADMALLFRPYGGGGPRRWIGIGEGYFAAGDIAPGIAPQIHDDGILPTDQPESATHVVAGGVVDFTTDDGGVETQGHACMRARAGRECQG